MSENKFFFTLKEKGTCLKDNAELLESFTSSFEVITLVPTTIINTTTGAKMMESCIVPIFLLLPRKQVLSNIGSPNADVSSLNLLLNKFNKKNIRGKECSGISNQYATMGAHCRRFGKGFSITKVPSEYQKDYNHVTKKCWSVLNFLQKAIYPFP